MSIFDEIPGALLDSDLAEEVVYTDGALIAHTIPTIWNSGRELEQSRPGFAASAYCRLSDFTAAPKKGERITRAGRVYQIAEDPHNEEDGIGGVYLMLRLVQNPV